MRVTGGSWCSRRLRGPGRGMALRPTPDALRERVFAVLGTAVAGARMLDLFAGTGAVGIEALSRGAESVVLVERHRAAARLIRQNLESLAVPAQQARVLVKPATAAVRDLARTGQRFDLVWADPPFASWQEGAAAIALASELGLLAAHTIACLECPATAAINELPPGLVLTRDLGGGASRVLLLAPGGVYRTGDGC